MNIEEQEEELKKLKWEYTIEEYESVYSNIEGYIRFKSPRMERFASLFDGEIPQKREIDVIASKFWSSKKEAICSSVISQITYMMKDNSVPVGVDVRVSFSK